MPEINKYDFFTGRLLAWYYASSPRVLPWKEDRNPYYIWLSEIILQQTRVSQGMPYFLKFKALYPTISDLASAPIDDVLKAWQGLGYYSRARNLHATAQHIHQELAGDFPTSYEEVIKLKGIGPYTAAAICSFAYNMPHAVVDGNVYRVLSRFFGISTATDSTIGKKEFASLAQLLIEPARPGDYNQAIMDFGATQCTPGIPNCSTCDLNAQCVAYCENIVNQLPRKEKKIKKKKRFFQFLIIEEKGKVMMEKREANDIWKGLYQFPLIETKRAYQSSTFLSEQKEWQWIQRAKPIARLKQVLTHQEIDACFWHVELTKGDKTLRPYIAANIQNIHKFAVPKIIDLFLLETKGNFVQK